MVKKGVAGCIQLVSLGMPLNAAPAEPCGLMIYSGKLYVGDVFAEKLLEVER